MPINRKHRIELLLGISSVVAAGFFRLVMSETDLSYQCLLSMLLLTVYLRWLLASRRRFQQRGMRRILTFSAALMMLWNIVKTIRTEFIPYYSSVGRHIRYWYCLPMVMLPVLLLAATFYIGRTDSYELPRRWLLMPITAAAVAAGIVTNDLHQLAFRFDSGVPDSTDDYSYGPLYLCAVGILILCVGGILFRTLRSCSKRQFSRSFLLPAVMTALGGLYFLTYTNSGEPMLFQRMYDLPDFVCLFFVCFWESLVVTRMLPSNADHEEFFRASSINAGLVDNDLNIVLHGEESPLPEKEQLIAAEENEVIADGRVLKVQPVAGGYFYWLEDMRELQKLNMRLEETRSYLEEEHAMLDAATRLEEGRRRTAEQNRLYDSISKRLQPRFDSLSARLDSLPEDEEGFRSSMKRAAIDGVFIKRSSNLLLLAGSDEYIDSGELGLSLGEALDYLALSDIFGQADIPRGTALPSETVLFMFDLFGIGVEAALPKLNAVMVTLDLKDGIRYRIELDVPIELPDMEKAVSRAELLGGRLDMEINDEDAFITFSAKGGGDI